MLRSVRHDTGIHKSSTYLSTCFSYIQLPVGHRAVTWNRHKRFAKLIRGDVEAWIFGRHISVRRIECDPHTPDKPIIHDPHQKILDIRKSRAAWVDYTSALIAVPYAAEDPVARVRIL